ncbi:hypothetical protein PJP10_31140, partial [Mycobacterium kansasii]
GARRRRAQQEESEDEFESEDEENEDGSEAEIKEEEEEEEPEAQDAEESSPPATQGQGTDRATIDARLACLEEGQAALQQKVGRVRTKLSKVSRTLKAILCCLQDKNAPPPSPDPDT